jgi:uncharacterized protein
MKTLALTVLIALAATSASAQSFNCRAASSATEATICQDAELASLDERLARAYARSDSSRHEQRRWLRHRDRCGMRRGCIEAFYRQRLRELRD